MAIGIYTGSSFIYLPWSCHPHSLYHVICRQCSNPTVLRLSGYKRSETRNQRGKSIALCLALSRLKKGSTGTIPVITHQSFARSSALYSWSISHFSNTRDIIPERGDDDLMVLWNESAMFRFLVVCAMCLGKGGGGGRKPVSDPKKTPKKY